MCGRVVQSSGPLRLAIVEGLDVSDSRLGNVPRRYNAAPNQELLVIRQNHRGLGIKIVYVRCSNAPAKAIVRDRTIGLEP